MAEVKPITPSPVDFSALLEGLKDGPALAPPGNLPPPKAPDLPDSLKAKPELAAPLMAAGLALEVLMEALGAEERKTVVKTSKESLKAKAAERKAANDKQLNEMKVRLEKMAKQKTLNGFLKAFKIIGMIVGTVAAAATIVAGVLTANPLLIAGGVVMGILAVDSIVSMASDGKYGIAQGLTAALKAMGVDEKTAGWIAMGVTLALAALGILLTLGGAAAGSAGTVASKAGTVVDNTAKVINNTAKVVDNTAKVVDNTAKVIDNTAKVIDNTAKVIDNTAKVASNAAKVIDNTVKVADNAAKAAKAAEKAAKVINTVRRATQIANAANTAAEAAVGIVATVNQYDIEKSRVRSKELEAILARLQEATEVEQEFLKAVMQKFDNMLGKIRDLVQANNETQAAILGGNPGAPTGGVA